MSVYIDSSYAPTYSANNPVIGAGNIAIQNTPTASSDTPGRRAINAADPGTTAYWSPAKLPAEWIVPFEGGPISYCGIAAHNLSGTGCTVTVQGWNGTGWDDLGTATPTNDSAMMFLFGEYTTTQMRIVVNGVLPPFIGVISFGQLIELPRPVYQGYVPIDLATNVEFTTNMTRSGNFMSRTVKYSGRENSVVVNNIPEDWIRNNFLGFIEESQQLPFFLAERPQDYPAAVDYCMTPASIRPNRNGPRNLMSVTL